MSARSLGYSRTPLKPSHGFRALWTYAHHLIHYLYSPGKPLSPCRPQSTPILPTQCGSGLSCDAMHMSTLSGDRTTVL